MSEPTRITVAGEQPYDVVVGTHLLDELPGLLGHGTQRVLVVHPKALRATGEGVRDALAEAGFEAFLAEVPDAEEAKTAQVAAFLWGVLGQAGFTRTDAVVGLGGGATTDLAGFVAATWLRGVRVVQVPTTLAAMVDAAVGGKTGINTAEGKNLVGAFHPPAAVLCDLTTLQTLPRNDFVAGLAEVVKCGLIADPAILALIEDDPQAATAWDAAHHPRAGRAQHPGQGGRGRPGPARVRPARGAQLRAHLRPRRGARRAVRLAARRGGQRRAWSSRPSSAGWRGGWTTRPPTGTASCSASLGLPTTYRQDRWEQLLVAMRRDKKTRGDLLRFVVLDGLARPSRLEGPDPALLHAAYSELAADQAG